MDHAWRRFPLDRSHPTGHGSYTATNFSWAHPSCRTRPSPSASVALPWSSSSVPGARLRAPPCTLDLARLPLPLCCSSWLARPPERPRDRKHGGQPRGGGETEEMCLKSEELASGALLFLLCRPPRQFGSRNHPWEKLGEELVDDLVDYLILAISWLCISHN
jgi:hypothetical protein